MPRINPVKVSAVKKGEIYFKIDGDGKARLREVTFVPPKGKKKTKHTSRFVYKTFSLNVYDPMADPVLITADSSTREQMNSWLEDAFLYEGKASIARVLALSRRKTPELAAA